MKQLALALLLGFFLSACAPEGLRVNEILIGASLNEQQEIEEETVNFTPDQLEFHVHAVVEGLDGPIEVIGSWWFATQKIYESRVTVESAAPMAKFVLTSTKLWPVGRYTFVLSHEGEELISRELDVAEAE